MLTPTVSERVITLEPTTRDDFADPPASITTAGPPRTGCPARPRA